jgi:hypothetical protein
MLKHLMFTLGLPLALAAADRAAAQAVQLDCEVSVDSRELTSGRQSPTESRGVWEIEFREGIRPILNDARIEKSQPYGLPVYGPASPSTEFLHASADTTTITPDEIVWCPSFHQCGVQLPFAENWGWYRIGEARIDRRRGTFAVRVESYQNTIHGFHMVYDYRGTCAPRAARQF